MQLKWGWLLEKQLKYDKKPAKLLDSDGLAGMTHTWESGGFFLWELGFLHFHSVSGSMIKNKMTILFFK